ncbi:lysM and putative peptidoglycan-binding domain-containing protein 1 [Aythya fuligula]|uniref:LysM and putative peptidoglycan-binding domain-containing protein 1 n=1 Tax=Aythya fuligula TaxID=219594 RepID=A0A6J3EGD0_AYTFU|nr:lysM and putative peptidoglycan-binding domain-containing protein 1 [Aythya fuligula]
MAGPPPARGAAGGREHRLEPGDTLPGLALRYGVTPEQILRANRLYASDPIFLKPTLLIPAPGGLRREEEPEEAGGGAPADPGPPAPSRHELSAADFLRQLDADIGRSKAAAAQRLRAASTGAAEAEGTPRPESGDPRLGPRLGPRPLTRTPRAAALRDAEDEIFTL